ncbi:MAG: tetratricopeptide repeat protein [Planctomycetota bacterium]|nr:tetratricopeptide repeat protein [Planctomycetota bacterium]
MTLQCPRCSRTVERPPSSSPVLCPYCQGAYLIPLQSHSGSQLDHSGVTLAHSPEAQRLRSSSAQSPAYQGPNKSQLQAAIEAAFQADPLTTYDRNVSLERLEELGQGGMGTVYRVKDKRLEREAALKVLISENADHHAIERFLREAKITARLSHPSIPPVYDAGRTPDGHPYMLMKVIEGETLQDKINQFHEGAFNEEQVKALLEVLIKVSEAVSYAHKNGVLHRDLKPENIMVGEFGEVLVMDWGIARDIHTQEEATELLSLSIIDEDEVERQGGLTLAGSVLGTPGYMSPEQASGDKVGPQTDVYALGAILTEILAGKLPITGDTTYNIIVKTVEGQVKLPRDYNPRIPAELNTIAKAALTLEKKDRTKTALKFARLLRAYLNKEPLPIHHYSIFERLLRWVQTKPVKALAVVSTLFILLITGVLVQTILTTIKEKEALDHSLRLETAAKEKEKIEKKQAQARMKLANEKASIVAKIQSDARHGRPLPELKKRLLTALELGKDDEAFKLNLARICHEQGLVEDCQAILNELVEKHKPAYDALYFLHRIHLKSEKRLSFRTSPALNKLIQRAEERNEKNVYTEFMKGLKAGKRGDIDEALEYFNDAEKYNQNFYWIYIRRAIIYFQKNDLKKAFNEYKIAVQLDPLNALAFNNRGHIYQVQKQYQKALEDFNRAISLRPQFAMAYLNRGILRWNLRDTLGARRDFTLAIQSNPSFKVRVDRFLAQNDDNQSKGLPKDARSFNQRGFKFMNAKKYKRAIQDFDQAIKLNPNQSPAYTNRGICRFHLGNFEGALSDYNKSIAYKPFALTHNNRGYLFMERKQYQKALQDFNIAIKIDPRCSSAYNNRALLHSYLGKHREAIQDYDQCLLITPTMTESYYNRALSKEKIGDKKGAIEDYEQLIQLRPNDAKIPQWKTAIQQLQKP